MSTIYNSKNNYGKKNSNSSKGNVKNDNVKKKLNKKKVFLALFFFLSIFIYLFYRNNYNDFSKENIIKPINIIRPSIADTYKYNEYLKAIAEVDKNHSNSSYIIVRGDNLNILAAKEPEKKVYPASITKLTTDIIASMVFKDNLNDVIEITKEDKNIPEGYIATALKPGDKITIANLLKSSLIMSANDSTKTLKRLIDEKLKSKNVEFSENESIYTCLFKILNITNTNYTNPYGLFDENHYTTATDQIIIAIFGNKYTNIEDITKISDCDIPYISSNGEKKSFKIHSTNLFLNNNSPFYNPNVVGLKTGYTTESGYCLITKVYIQNIPYYIAVFNTKTNDERFALTKELIDKTNDFASNNISNLPLSKVAIPAFLKLSNDFNRLFN